MNTTLKPDEKLCPFCAEPIKAAAVKCRYCGSDLPVEDAAPVVDLSKPAPEHEPPRPSAPSEPPAAASVDGEPVAVVRERSSRLSRPTWPAGRARALQVVLGVLVIALAVALFFAIRHVRASDTAPDGQLTSAGARAAIMSRTTTLTESALSYSAASFDADAQKAGKLMTPDMAQQYRKTLAKVRKDVVARGMTLKASVQASALISATDDRAKVLEFINQTTTAKGAKTQQLNVNRVVVTVVKRDGVWRISGLNAF